MDDVKRPGHKRLISAPEAAQYQRGNFTVFAWLANEGAV
jgi:hypothetical protein